MCPGLVLIPRPKAKTMQAVIYWYYFLLHFQEPPAVACSELHKTLSNWKLPSLEKPESPPPPALAGS